LEELVEVELVLEELEEEEETHLLPGALASSMDAGANSAHLGGFDRRMRPEFGKNGIRLFVNPSSSIARTTTRARSF
jgi:hypothetical protein